MTDGFNAQFERSGPATPPASPAKARVEVDGAVAMHKFAAQDLEGWKTMSGGEMFAIIGHLKQGEHRDALVELEKTLLKVRRQADKKIQLMEWVTANVSSRPAAAPLVDSTNVRPLTAPAEGAVIKRKMQQPSAVDQALGGGESVPPTPRAPLATAAPMADATAVKLVEEFAMGRDHLSMSGSELHGLVPWLKTRGHSDVEDALLKVKGLGDKKFQLCQHLRKHAVTLTQPLAMAPEPLVPEQPAYTAPPTPPPAEPLPPVVPALSMPPPTAHMMPDWDAPLQAATAHGVHSAAPTPRDMMMPQSALPTPRTADDRMVAQQMMMLGQTLDRMEESFNFQVQCMREDMQKAREQLSALSVAINRR